MVKKIIGIFSAVLCISMCLILPDTVRADEGPENEPAVYSELGTEEDGINTENINETTGAENISAPESGVNAEPGEGTGLGAGDGFGAPGAGDETNAAPSAQSVTLTMNGPDDPGFTVTVNGLSAPGGIKSLQAAVWSRADQRNLVWYTQPVVNEAGAYVFSSTLASHGNEEGVYFAHVYLTDNAGASYFIGGALASAEVSWSGISAAYDPASKTAGFIVNDLTACGLVDHFIYYVWSSNNGQDDIKAFSASSASGYSQTADMTQFRDTGTFYVHCYAFFKNGTNRFVDGKAFEVPAEGTSAEPSAGSVSIETAGQTSPGFTVMVTNVNAPSGIKELRAAVWSAADQSNLVWYTDYSAGSNGTYTFENCSLASHRSLEGRYNAHVYLVDNNGKAYFLGGVSKDIAVSYSGISASYDQESRQTTFTINGLSDYGLTGTVNYYVWSEAGGQDDI
ncbi:MAG: GBS Bsp-like repeat-containing protein, partial [Lachnospiraceae bacterium]|nr:GBS Bsp-like repeat-containing protein [Lachnospiraceae bacterium]